MALRFAVAERGGDQVVSAKQVSVGIGSRTLIERFSGTLERGDVQTFPQRLLWVSITSPRNVVVTVYGKRITIPKSGDFQLTVPRR